MYELIIKSINSIFVKNDFERNFVRGEWPSGSYNLRQVTEARLGRVMSNSGWVSPDV